VAGKFYLRKFSEINLDDSFFDTLKKDYPGSASSPSFSTWFDKKAQEGRLHLYSMMNKVWAHLFV
jgi:hypothetical protein